MTQEFRSLLAPCALRRGAFGQTLSFLALAGIAVACGPDKPADSAADQSNEQDTDNYDPTEGISAMAEVGALPEEQAVNAFKDSFPAIQDCFIRGAERIEFLGGDIAFFIQVNAAAEAEYIYAKETTIGDRETETCMIRALKKADWPAPVGGLVGIAENSFGFEMTGDVRPPVPWDSSQVEAALAENANAIAECKAGGGGSFTATVYVDNDGKAISAGVSAPDKESEAHSDCIVDVLKQATYPSPGSWPAKVTFSL
jgi:hypothetical protein